VETAPYTFILETNGTLIENDKSYARDLPKFSRLHVRVSLKGASNTEFSILTGAEARAFDLQLEALKNLLDYGVKYHPAVMLSFSSRESIEELVGRLADIDRSLVEELEEEYVFLYPHMVRRLKRARLKSHTLLIALLGYQKSSYDFTRYDNL